jgi:predicted transcriptional regulator
MEQETLFTSSKWDILQSLSAGEQSPIELARSSKTSVANISQQLRLLELAGFVKSRRISNRDKDKPRILYNLAGNYSFFIVSSPYFVHKKFFNLSEKQKAITRIWFLEEKNVQLILEKAFWQLEPALDHIKAIILDKTDYTKPTLFLVAELSDVAALKKFQQGLVLKDDHGVERTIKCVILGHEDARKKNGYVIYDPDCIVQKKSAEGKV